MRLKPHKRYANTSVCYYAQNFSFFVDINRIIKHGRSAKRGVLLRFAVVGQKRAGLEVSAHADVYAGSAKKTTDCMTSHIQKPNKNCETMNVMLKETLLSLTWQMIKGIYRYTTVLGAGRTLNDIGVGNKFHS